MKNIEKRAVNIIIYTILAFFVVAILSAFFPGLLPLMRLLGWVFFGEAVLALVGITLLVILGV